MGLRRHALLGVGALAGGRHGVDRQEPEEAEGRTVAHWDLNSGSIDYRYQILIMKPVDIFEINIKYSFEYLL